jgi:lysophospholipase L1-like esterase
MRRTLARLVLAVVATLAAAGAVEVALRLRERAPPAPTDLAEQLRRSAASDVAAAGSPTSLMGLVQPSPFPDVVYELKPNLVARFLDKPIRTNAFGMRGRELTRDKPPDTFRIVGIGDSVMFGWGVGEGEPYLQVLERRLAERDPTRRWECASFAVPGYNAAIEAAVFEHRAAAFDPDVVVVHFIPNDLGLPHFMQPAPAPGSRLRLVALLRERFGEPNAAPPLLGHRASLKDERVAAREQYQHMVGEAGYQRAMARLARVAAERDVPVLLLTLGLGRESTEPARAAARAHGFRFLDATPWFQREAAARGLKPRDWPGAVTIRGDGHPTALGHEFYAAFLLAELEKGLLPPVERASPRP